MLSALLSFAAAFLSQFLRGWLEDRRNAQALERAATAEATIKGMRESDDAIAKARNARETVRDAHTRDPGSIMHDDGFKRRDE